MARERNHLLSFTDVRQAFSSVGAVSVKCMCEHAGPCNLSFWKWCSSYSELAEDVSSAVLVNRVVVILLTDFDIM